MCEGRGTLRACASSSAAAALAPPPTHARAARSNCLLVVVSSACVPSKGPCQPPPPLARTHSPNPSSPPLLPPTATTSSPAMTRCAAALVGAHGQPICCKAWLNEALPLLSSHNAPALPCCRLSTGRNSSPPPLLLVLQCSTIPPPPHHLSHNRLPPPPLHSALPLQKAVGGIYRRETMVGGVRASGGGGVLCRAPGSLLLVANHRQKSGGTSVSARLRSPSILIFCPLATYLPTCLCAPVST